jgi:hypothetical protein
VVDRMRKEQSMNNVGSLIVLLVDFKQQQNLKGITNPLTMYSNFVKYYTENDHVFKNLPMMIVFSKALDIFHDYKKVDISVT